MPFIEDLPISLIDAVRSSAWSSPRSGALMQLAHLVREAGKAGRLSDDLLDMLAVAARTEIAAVPNPLPIMHIMLDGLRQWQSSPRSAACRAYATHGGYANADEALEVATRMLSATALAA